MDIIMSGTCALVVPWHVSGFGYATAGRRPLTLPSVTPMLAEPLLHVKCVHPIMCTFITINHFQGI